LKGKINVLEIVSQRVPGCRTGVGKRPSPVRGQIDTGKSSSPRPAERRWRRPGTLDTGWQSDDRYPGAIIIIIHEFHRDANLEQNFRAMLCRHLYTWTHSESNPVDDVQPVKSALPANQPSQAQSDCNFVTRMLYKDSY